MTFAVTGGHQRSLTGFVLKSSLVDVVNGGYTDWSAWSACTASCAGGHRYRERVCKNPMKQNGGNDCSSLGADKEEKICNTHLCPGGILNYCLISFVKD